MTRLEVPERITAAEYRREAKPILGKKPSKYKNVRTKSPDGIVHASKKQSMRWVLLRQMERQGKIRKLRREVTYRLEVNGHLICKYVADHVYEVFGSYIPDTWTTVVEDVKSSITRANREYRIKKKLMDAIYDIEILET